MRVSAKTDIGRSRAENQDNYRSGVLPNGACWGLVCDGMGGGYNGRLAGILAADCIEDVVYTGLAEKVSKKAIRALLEKSFTLANGEIYEKTVEEGQVMGTTAVCAVVRKDTLHLAHVGDSRAYLYSNGKLRLLTRDHSMVQELVEQGVLSEDEAQHHPDKNVITRALGVEDEIEVEYSERKIEKGSLLLLCTDGLTNMVEDSRLAELIEQTDFYDLAGAMVSEALLAGGNDNITAVLMQIEEDVEDAG